MGDEYQGREVTRRSGPNPPTSNSAYDVPEEWEKSRPVAVGIGVVLSIVVGVLTGLDAVIADGVWSWREVAMTLLPLITGTAVHPNVTPVARKDRGFRRKKMR